jgi:hypothetical protein
MRSFITCIHPHIIKYVLSPLREAQGLLKYHYTDQIKENEVGRA